MNIDAIEYVENDPIYGHNLYAYCANNPVIYVDPTGTSFLITLLVGALIGGLISGATGAVITAIQGGGSMDCLGSFVGNFIQGAILSAAMILGGGVSLGLVTGLGGAIGTTAFLTVGTFAGGVLSYAAESAISSDKVDWEAACYNGVLTAYAGLSSFIAGFYLGNFGYFENLKPGNGLGSSIIAAKDFFMLEAGMKGIIPIAAGLGAYVGVNMVPSAIRSIVKYIFTWPWKNSKPQRS